METLKEKKVSDSRKRILLAASDLFYDFGYVGTSLRDIALKIGLTQASIYYHFRNKEEILYTIIEEASNKLFFNLKSCFNSKKDPIEKLRDAISQHIFAIKKDRKGAKIIIEDKRFLSGELQKLAKDKEKAIFYLYKNCLSELKDLGKIRENDLTVATFGIFGMINWIYHWYRPEKDLTLEQLAERIVSILFFGLLSERNQKSMEEFYTNIFQERERGE